MTHCMSNILHLRPLAKEEQQKAEYRFMTSYPHNSPIYAIHVKQIDVL